MRTPAAVIATATTEVVNVRFWHSGHPDALNQCPLLGVKRTSRGQALMSAFDPKRTFARSAGAVGASVLRKTNEEGLRFFASFGQSISCHEHSTFLALVNFRIVNGPHRFSAGRTETEIFNPL
jgi:hypothetical protein